MKFICIIPSRFASTRLPGKPLIDIAGKPMVQCVYEQAAKAKKPVVTTVATDDPRIYDVVTSGRHDAGRSQERYGSSG